MTTHSPLRSAVTAVTLLTLGAGSLRAQNSLDTTFTVARGARLNIQNQQGSIEVHGWNRGQIRVRAEYEKARVEIGDAGSNVWSVRSTNRRGNGEVDYSITVPLGTRVEVNGVSTDVSVTGVCGAVSIDTANGDITVQCIEGDAQVQSLNGDIGISDARGSLDVSTTNGEIDVRGARGPVTLRAISGDISLTEISGTEVDVETVSGDVDFSGRIVDNGRYRFAAHSGDVTLRVSGTLNAQLSAETFSGDFSSDFPIEIRPGTRLGHQWEFQLGTGSARVRLSSFSGSVNLRRGLGSNSREE